MGWFSKFLYRRLKYFFYFKNFSTVCRYLGFVNRESNYRIGIGLFSIAICRSLLL